MRKRREETKLATLSISSGNHILILKEEGENISLTLGDGGNCISMFLNENHADKIRVFFFEHYRKYKRKLSRDERKRKNQLLFGIAQAQGKRKPDSSTEKVYEKITEEYKSM